MSTLLHIAYRVEAAAEAYRSIKEHANQEAWKARFSAESTKTILAFNLARDQHPQRLPPKLHPILAALAIVLDKKEDLSKITRDHPELTRHKYYDPQAVFPELEPFRASGKDCWWEDLVAQSLPAPTPEAAAASQDLPTAPQEVPAAPQELPAATQDAPAAAEAPAARDAPVSEVQRRSEDEPVAQHPVPTVKLIPPPAPLQRHQQGSDGDGDGDGDVEMAEVPPKISQRIRKRKAPDSGAAQSSKRAARASRLQAEASGGSDDDGSSSALTPPGPPQVTFQCVKCLQKGVPCVPAELGPCTRCKEQKVRCSLMPRHSESGKPNRGPLTAEEVYQYRLEQVQAKKGKAARREVPQPQASGSGRSAGSPSAAIQPLLALTLESGSSNAASPSTQLPPLSWAVELPARKPPRRPVSPPVQPSAGRITIPAQGKMQRPRRQASPTALSQSSEDGLHIMARMTALEARLERLERRFNDAGL